MISVLVWASFGVSAFVAGMFVINLLFFRKLRSSGDAGDVQVSILIPARNEMFLGRTIQDILEHIEADTELLE